LPFVVSWVEAFLAADLWNSDWSKALAENSENFIGVSDTVNIVVGKEGTWENEVLLGFVDSIESLESRFRPNAETSKGSSWGKSSKRKAGNAHNINAWDVAESLSNTIIVGVDNKWTTLVLVSRAPHLALGGTVNLVIKNTSNIIVKVESLKSGDGFTGLLDSFDSIGSNKWDFSNIFDNVTASLDKSGDSGSGNGGCDGITALLDWDSAEPAAHDCWGTKKMTTTAEVSVGTLSVTVGSGTIDTWNTSLGTAWTP